jgi:hypothetical protein
VASIFETIFYAFYRHAAGGMDGQASYLPGLVREAAVTNIMLYWLTGTIESSFQPYHDIVSADTGRWMKEKAKEWLGSSRTTAAFALFPKDISSPLRQWAERFFNVQRWTEMPRGGHFAAMGAPEELAKDIREFF